MATNRFTQRRRTPRQGRADERAERLGAILGKALAGGRDRSQQRQADVADTAGLSPSCWSDLERGKGARMSLRVWMRAADAVGSDLRAYLEHLPGTDRPRDAMHLRIQELVASIASGGAWRIGPEQTVGGIGFADMLLARRDARALVEIWTWLADVGDAFRTWQRKLDAFAATSATRPAGCWVLRATRRNRELVATHRTVFAARFPGSGRAWLRALANPSAEPPHEPALLWVTVRGDRLFAARR